MVGDDNQEQSDSIIPFPLLTKSAVESLRYRAEVFLSKAFRFLKQCKGFVCFVWIVQMPMISTT